MNSGDLLTIEDLDRVEEYASYEDAEKWLDGSMLKSQDWEIIEVEI
jgi:hypothetical protein